jgi:hypothetical protein
VRGNSGTGITAASNGGNVITRNSAGGNGSSGTDNYNIGGGNDAGPIGSAASSTSPWANLQ